MTAELINSDRRIFERFSAKFPAKVKDSRGDYGTGISLRDASAQGLKLTSKERLYLNDSVILDVKLPDSDVPLTLKGQVVWARAGALDVWDIGIRFHEIKFIHLSRLYQFIEPHPVSS